MERIEIWPRSSLTDFRPIPCLCPRIVMSDDRIKVWHAIDCQVTTPDRLEALARFACPECGEELVLREGWLQCLGCRRIWAVRESRGRYHALVGGRAA